MPDLDPGRYGPIIADLLKVERIPPLGPGRPNQAVHGRLQSATIEQLFAHAAVRDRGMAEACQSGLWLYHDFLDESHTISQNINTPTGSYWHGIMHRREPDFSNAAYWFRRVGNHPVFPDLAQAARGFAETLEPLDSAEAFRNMSKWDPFSFIKLCESVFSTAGPNGDFCRRVCLIEWQLLFDHSYRHAVAP